MADLPLNEPAGVLVKTTCVDYPGILAGSFFLKGCNLRCPYCYNTGLVLGNDNNENYSTILDLFNHLEKRQGILKGLTVSGGEPLLNPYTPLIIKKAKSLGYLVKLDTNGTLPQKLEQFINNPELKPDFIAMDIKTSPARYASLLCNKTSSLYGNAKYFEEELLKSIKLISSYPVENREWRTVLVPGLITKEDIKAIGLILPKDASWQFAQFMNQNTIDKSYSDLYPYTDNEAQELIDYAKTFIENSCLR